MKTSLIKLAAAVGLGCMIATPAFAQEHKFEVTPLIGYTFYDNDFFLEDSDYIGLGFGYVINPQWTVEAFYTDGDADIRGTSGEVDTTSYRLDALYHLPKLGKFTPYIVAGVGRSEIDGSGLDADASQINLGLGLKRQLSHSWNLRADVRAFDNIDQGDDLDDFGTDYAVQLGLTYAFGGNHTAPAVVPAPRKIVDTDGDGVPDTADACPNTPRGVKVNSRGCPLDTDRDGVYDYLDKCPGTARNLKVDNDGCPIKLTQSVDIQLQVNFDTNKAIVKPQYYNEIKRVADFMKQYENTRVEVQGHTDSRGSAAYNESLSQRRAAAVAAVLVREHGVNPANVSARGYGESNPIASNDNEQGRAANRRVVGQVSARIEKLEQR